LGYFLAAIAALYVTLSQQPPQNCAHFVKTSLIQKLLITFFSNPISTTYETQQHCHLTTVKVKSAENSP
jgi:hypothetical protein